MSSDDDTPSWLRDYRPIEVDISTLDQFARVLQEDLDANFVPHMARVLGGLDPGTDAFPLRETCLELSVAWWMYGDCKSRTADLLSSYADATRALAQAARTVAANYHTVDQLAGARVADVEQAFPAPDPSRMDF